MADTTELLEDIRDAVLDGDIPAATQLVQAALDAGVQPGSILNHGMIPAMDEVGRLYECGDFYLAEMLVAASSSAL